MKNIVLGIIIILLLDITSFASIQEDALKEYKAKNYTLALKLFTDSCSYEKDLYLRGASCEIIAELYDNGFGGVSKNETVGFKYHETACSLNQKTCLMLGASYTLGRGVEKNEYTAQKYFKKACDAGDKEACSFLQ